MKKYEHAFGKNDIRGIYGDDITEELYPYINELTGRKPIILPIILDIKKEK